jgi:hypothetical protein
MSANSEVNHDKLMELFGDVFNDVAGSIAVMLSYLGDQTGVYRAMDKLQFDLQDKTALLLLTQLHH